MQHSNQWIYVIFTYYHYMKLLYIMNYNKIIYIKLLNFQSQAGQQSIKYPLYFQFRLDNYSYFSSLINPSTQKIITINQHLIFSMQNLKQTITALKIIRWESHIPIFRFELEIEEIIIKKFYWKKIETKSQQFLTLAVCYFEQNQIQFSNIKSNRMIHYYSFDRITYNIISVSEKTVISQNIPSFYKIIVGNKTYIISILIKQFSILIQLPETIIFQVFINNILIGKSKIIKSQQLQQMNKFNLDLNNVNIGSIQTYGRWGINQSNHTQLNYLVQTNELLLYQIEIQFEKQIDIPFKVKFIYNNKSYDLNSDINDKKKFRFKKILYILLKSQDQEIIVFLEKNNIDFAHFKIFTYELTDNQFTKKKINDNNNKEIGNIKFKVQIGKTLSLPQNNRVWRENYKKKIPSNYLIIIDQISCCNYIDQIFDLHIDAGSNIIITNLADLSHYNTININLHQQSKPEYFHIKDQNSIYFLYQAKVKKPNSKNLVAMAIVDIKSLKLGITPLTLAMLNKDKNIVGQINFLINKIPNLHFCKPNISKDISLLLKKKNRNISLKVSPLTLSVYYLTYIYQKLNEIYCVIQINKHKKVLIFQKSETNQLIFKQGVGSDYLNFTIDQNQYIQIKLTLLISDLGFEQQIYGTIALKQRYFLLEQNGGISIDDIEVKNEHQIVVGWISLKIKKCQNKKYKNKFLNNQIIKQKQEQNLKLSKNYKSLENRLQKKLIISQQDVTKNKKKLYQEKLPPINKSLDMKQIDKFQTQRPKELIQIDDGNLSQNIKKLEEVINNKKKLMGNGIKKRIQLIKQRKNQRLQPALDRSNKILKKIINEQIKMRNPQQQNFDIYNKKKSFQKPVLNTYQPISTKIKLYHEKLSGLKSILNQMNVDMKVQPSKNTSARSKQMIQIDKLKQIKAKLLEGHDIEDNQFISRQLKNK